jgi:hypothetical protein
MMVPGRLMALKIGAPPPRFDSTADVARSDRKNALGRYGIGFVSGGALHVQNCVIRKAGSGILFLPASGTPELYVADSVIADALTDTLPK